MYNYATHGGEGRRFGRSWAWTATRRCQVDWFDENGMNIQVFGELKFLTHTIHVWYVFLHERLIFMEIPYLYAMGSIFWGDDIFWIYTTTQ